MGGSVNVKRVIGRVVSFIIKIGILFAVIYPFVWLVLSSLKFEQDIVQYPPKLWPNQFTFTQYIRVWSKLPMFTMFKNTLLFSASVTVSNCLLCAMGGYAFARIEFRGRKLLFVLILMTMMIPFQIIMIPLYILEHMIGILDTFWGLILPRLTWPFAIYLMRSFFISLPKNLEEAGRIDGASEYRIFWQIMLPLCKAAMITVGIMTFTNNWNDLVYPLLLTNSVTMRTLSAGLAMFVGQRIIEYGATLAASMISLIPLLAAFLFMQKYFVKGIALSGMKI
ncbi:MAG: carbohydrate ABC transporter permease [Clostridiaceae bacterium]|nr:carbohydrate ABC transporter permease [Clostridiaceae bacterium]